MKRWFWWLLVCFMVVFPVVACAGRGPVATKNPLPALEPVSRSESLVITTPYEQYEIIPSDNMNPFNYPGILRSTGADITIYEQLMYTNLLTGELVPWLAESFTASTDYKRYTVKLRQGVTWSDSVPFTCEDVRYTLEMMKNTPFADTTSKRLVYIRSRLAEVGCTDPLTVEINLTVPDPRFFTEQFATGSWDVITILPKHIWENQNPLTFTNFSIASGSPVGTGAYRLVAANNQQMIYDRRDGWWAVKLGIVSLPAPRRIILQSMNTSQFTDATAMMVDNSIDYGLEMPLEKYLSVLGKNPHIRAWTEKQPGYSVSNGCTYTLNINTQQSLFTDTNIRLAINYSINRQEIVDKALQQESQVFVLPISSYISNQWMTNDIKSIVASYHRDQTDMELVKHYMQLAGYSQQQGMWVKDGEPIRFRFNTPYSMAEIGTVVTDQMTKAGFIIERLAQPENDTSNWSKVLFSGDFDIMLSTHCDTYPDPLGGFQVYHSRYYQQAETNCQDFRSYCRYRNQEMDYFIEIMENKAPSFQDIEFMQAFTGALEVFLQDMPEIILAESRSVYPVNDTYWSGWPAAVDPYASLYAWANPLTLILSRLQAVEYQ